MRPFSTAVRAAWRSLSTTAILAGAFIASGPRAWADTDDGVAKKNTWDVSLGAGAVIESAYPGSKKYRAQPIPMITVNYRDLVFFGPDGLGVNVLNWRGLRAGPVMGFDMGRKSSDDHHIDGLRNIQMDANAGGFLSYERGPFEVAATLRQAFVHSDNGLTGKLDAHYRYELIAQKTTLGFGPEVDFGDGKNMQTWFGVTLSEAARSRFRAYNANGGVKDVGANAFLSNRFTDHIVGRIFVDVKELVGDAADSPIVQQKTEVTTGIGVAYHF